MLGKRPHQIQRTTSMSQLRVPPGARPRTPARDFMPAGQRSRKPADIAVQPKALLQETGLRVDSEPQHAAAIMHHTDYPSLPPSLPTHMMPAADQISKATAGAFSSKSSNTSWTQSSLFSKHAMPESFMDACYSCNKALGHGRDIFMYRGDTAFCSEDCRLRQINYDEHRQKRSTAASQGSSGTVVDAVGTANSGQPCPHL